jgi:hypothetical protein
VANYEKDDFKIVVYYIKAVVLPSGEERTGWTGWSYPNYKTDEMKYSKAIEYLYKMLSKGNFKCGMIYDYREKTLKNLQQGQEPPLLFKLDNPNL